MNADTAETETETETETCPCCTARCCGDSDCCCQQHTCGQPNWTVAQLESLRRGDED